MIELPDDPVQRIGSRPAAERHARVHQHHPRLATPDLRRTLSPELPISWGPEVFDDGRREFAVNNSDGRLVIFSGPADGQPAWP